MVRGIYTRLGEYDKNNTAIQETIYLGDTPVAVVKPDPLTGLARTFYIHADHLNAPRVIVNTGNDPVWRWDNSDAFDLGLPDQDPDGNTIIFEYNLRFPGQYYDKQTGLFYNYQRYYDPFTGRYISEDPPGLANGLAGLVNPYSYVDHNPLNSIDPFGLELTVGFGQGIRNLADGAKLPNGGEGVASMSGPASPLGPVQCAADAASNAAPIGKLGAVVGGLGKVLAKVPGRVQARINLSNKGFDHVLSTHLNSARAANKSQFTLSQSELRSLLSSQSTIQAPATALETGNFARTITTNTTVGNLADKMGGGSTNTFTVITDKFGNLQSAFPGRL